MGKEQYNNLNELLERANITDFNRNPQFVQIASQIGTVCVMGNEQYDNTKVIRGVLSKSIQTEIPEFSSSMPNFIFEARISKAYDLMARTSWNKYLSFRANASQEKDLSNTEKSQTNKTPKVLDVVFALNDSPSSLKVLPKPICVACKLSDGKREINFYNRHQVWLGKAWLENFAKDFLPYVNVEYIGHPSLMPEFSRQCQGDFMVSSMSIPDNFPLDEIIKEIKSQILSKNAFVDIMFLPKSKRNCALTMGDLLKNYKANQSLFNSEPTL